MPGANAFVTEAFTLLGVALGMIILRTIARATSVGIRNFQLDDYMMLLAAVVYSLETAAAYIVGAWWRGLANNGMTPEERASLDPSSQEYALRVGGSKTQVIGWSLYTFLLWNLKLCMCVFYSRLTDGLAHMKIRIRIGYGLIGATYIATLLSILLGCRPLHKNWQINPDPGNSCQPAISKIDCLVTVVLNVVTDMYLISIPLPLLWKAQLSKRRKSLFLIVFGGGFFVMACGILRCALILLDPVNGAQQAGSWAVRETFVAVVIDNIPMIYPLCRRLIKNIDESLASHYAGRHKLSNGYSSSGSYAMNSRKDKKPKFVHPLSMRNATLSDSAESIVRADRVKNGQDILIVKESTVDVSPTEHSNEEIREHPHAQHPGVGYAATCNHAGGRGDVLRISRRGSAQWESPASGS
ncbi:hypothetical protein EPUS_02745 [Endocarpon pusillum Z07020]|uniref:Rhodopsin domain-containing protein n=1 Tax=Endocarpon pusillum (strain Z07020 / HMAS-L-300199) TaxID=1263415 RepID=U1HHG3_ENDPU|nr:uncharacterized protein EPUS_02745 [Endocarpon pusillum Z07020]ERF68289.1 hypothetical protein EPUS_02745 [Endocarpon pusillum Z07020]